MNITKIVDVEVGVDVEPEDVLDELSDSALEELGYRRLTEDGERRHQALMLIARTLEDMHRNEHSSPSMRGCGADPCRSIPEDGMTFIDKARQSHWGRD